MVWQERERHEREMRAYRAEMQKMLGRYIEVAMIVREKEKKERNDKKAT